jgi:hypothetical protein
MDCCPRVVGVACPVQVLQVGVALQVLQVKEFLAQVVFDHRQIVQVLVV